MSFIHMDRGWVRVQEDSSWLSTEEVKGVCEKLNTGLLDHILDQVIQRFQTKIHLDGESLLVVVRQGLDDGQHNVIEVEHVWGQLSPQGLVLVEVDLLRGAGRV